MKSIDMISVRKSLHLRRRPPLLDFIIACSIYRLDFVSLWFDIIRSSTTAPQYKWASAANTLAIHCPAVFLTDDLSGLIQPLAGPLITIVSNALLSALIRIASAIPEDSPDLIHMLDMTRRAFEKQVADRADCQDCADLADLMLPVICVRNQDHCNAMRELLIMLFDGLTKYLNPFWLNPDVNQQMLLCAIVKAAFKAGWLSEDQPVVDWLCQIVDKNVIEDHIKLIPYCWRTMMKERIERLWLLLHPVGLPSTVAEWFSFQYMCFKGLEKVVTLHPQVACHCEICAILQGMQMKCAKIVYRCARIACVVLHQTQANVDWILQASIEALRGWALQKWSVEAESALRALWKAIDNWNCVKETMERALLQRSELLLQVSLQWVISTMGETATEAS
jgi:hypothetical protein